MGDIYVDLFEWEVLERIGEVNQAAFEKKLYDIGHKCTLAVRRDDEYRLTATLNGIIHDPKALDEHDSKISGEIAKGDTLRASSPNGLYSYTFRNAHLLERDILPISIDPIEMSYRAGLSFDSLEIASPHTIDLELLYLNEWYLSGPLNVHWPRATTRVSTTSITRNREPIDENNGPQTYTSSSSNKDHLLIDCDDFKFVIAKVPDRYGPKWSEGLCLEYRKEFGNIPSAEIREGISEFIGFIFGHQLLKIGETQFGQAHALIKQVYCNPWGDNVIAKCQRLPMAPVYLKRVKDNWFFLENLIKELLPKYLMYRDELSLRDAIWKYWMATHAPLGINLPILSSGLETFASKLIKQYPSLTRHHMPQKEFVELIKPELDSISEKLEKNPGKSKVMNKLKTASLRGMNEKFNLIFEILDLPTNKLESKALRARNIMAHSSMGTSSNEKVIEALRLTRAYQTLFHRIVLKALGHVGHYKDYYTKGHPVRKSTQEPVGGHEADI